MRIRLVTYSTKPRGGVVHALSLAEALGDRGHDVELWALSADGAAFFRPPRVPARLVPVDRRPGEDVEARILRYAEALADGLRAAGPADVHHAEDCLSARSLLALRAEGRIPAVVRTVHHVDDFASEVLRECQRASIEDVDHRICVSRHWADALAREHGVGADVIPNGVDSARFAGCRLGRGEAGARLGWGARPAILAIGGIEPRKGSRTLLEAFDRARGALGPGALLAVAGGETLFDYADYRAAWEDDAARLGLRVHRGPGPPASADVAVLGPVADAEMPTLYRAADVFAFPSEREGFGLVVLEAQAAGLPVVASDLPVLREFLAPGDDCLMVPAGDPGALAGALLAAAAAGPARERLVAAGRETARRFTWEAAAAAHEAVYEALRVPA
ncbi:MAG TPA: MSMEG_0565 family glycosyltransferase [Miltoncostaeaceae bacterium]|nr:MSMEG_0565 family glycosyltransferase [Miltoncostaeaceae bacterium]